LRAVGILSPYFVAVFPGSSKLLRFLAEGLTAARLGAVL